MSAPIVSVADLRIHFPTQDRRETVKAVDGVSFDVMPGETFGIIGESGSGKSTLGRAVVCLLKPTEGQVKLGGIDPNPRCRIVFGHSAGCTGPGRTRRGGSVDFG